MRKQQTKQERRSERREEQRLLREAQARAARQRRFLVIGSIIVALLVVVAVGVSLYLSRTASTAKQSKTASVPTTAPLSPLALGNIDCNSSEQLTYHVHAHLSLYINGQAVAIPANVGIDDNDGCYYWLHTHDTSGVIHIEAPQQGTYTLGTFFRLWGQRFSQLGYPQQLNQVAGWQVYVNGKPYNGDFDNITLNAHTLITMAYNSPSVTPDTVFNWGDL